MAHPCRVCWNRIRIEQEQQQRRMIIINEFMILQATVAK